MDELVDFKAELARLEKEKAAVQKELDFVNSKLNNENFVSKAPAAVVEKQRQAKMQLEEKTALIEESIQKLAKK